MNKRAIIIILLIVLILSNIFWIQKNFKGGNRDQSKVVPSQNSAISEDSSFGQNLTLEETGNMEESKSKVWWLNSGGEFFQKDGIGSTVRGDLPLLAQWRARYAKSNPKDTDNGAHPQNLFRLVNRGEWLNLSQEVYFKITKDNFSDSPNRNESNGILLFNRYLDGDNLYYGGIRVDGDAVIKKKIEGDYYTMAEKKVFEGDSYDRNTKANLIPKNSWIGIKSEVSGSDNGVIIKLYLDKNMSGKWELILTAKDGGESFGGEAILDKGHGGIRTDFMDVQFKDYKISEIPGS